ncbi:MAG: hypothetical protein EXR96_06745 [Nitrospiraceae bacterium]|nr:hypothetical protein [Nitrospiraceae bacterium]
MLKILGITVLLGSVFLLGYYTGQRPAEVRKAVKELSSEVIDTTKDLSRNVIDTTQGLERTLRYRQGVVDAKERLLEARSDLNDKNFGDAAKELAEAVTYLEGAGLTGEVGGKAANARALAAKIKDVEGDLSKGKTVSREKMSAIQKELDSLLQK